MDSFWAAPPVSRTLTAATFVASVMVYGGLLDARHLIFYVPWILRIPPQLWRLCTSFLITGPGLSVLFDTYFLYTFGSELEKSSWRFRQPGDFFVYICFVCLMILLTAGLLLGGVIFTAALTLALTYTYSQDFRGRKVSFFIASIPVEFLPYAVLVLTLVTGGPKAALSQGTGLLAAHMYDFLTRIWPMFGGGRNFIVTPRAIGQWFAAGTPAVATRAYGTAYSHRDQAGQGSQQQQASTGRSTGFSTGVSSVWSSRGAGRRLGGD